ncbi:DUF3558 family protein [Actinokineospora spheciospongiae]|uniref:DUF3558 family protein n=1 Tax=Actinokineospora spheciospongiae TaxID=909613 RepID=UPI0009FBB96E|nr:DUF3558 family protein [Actinokineospora spheciospongiae]PWW63502.1 uncharacterized protein DUF3558 [Actinokineospora spheciospongiae]
MTVRSFAAVTAVVLSLFAAGCSADEPTGPPPPAPIGDGPLRLADPCTLLPASAVSEAGLRPATPGPARDDGYRDCRWVHGEEKKFDHQVNVTIIASAEFPTVQDNKAFAVDTMSPGGREGKRLRYQGTAGCQYVLDTAPAERVSMTVLASTGTVEEACALLDSYATSMVKALPAGV